MQNLKTAFLLLSGLSLAFILDSCLKDPIVDNPPKLPPITCEAEGTGGCLVNGDLFLPKGAGSLIGQYNFKDNSVKGSFRLAITRRSEREAVRIVLYNMVFDTGYYKLGYNNIYIGSARYYNITDHVDSYYCGDANFGILHITKIDTIERIICGTFAFDAVNQENDQDTIRIREGRFDVKFIY